jgi:hypothetical protein
MQEDRYSSDSGGTEGFVPFRTFAKAFMASMTASPLMLKCDSQDETSMWVTSRRDMHMPVREEYSNPARSHIYSFRISSTHRGSLLAALVFIHTLTSLLFTVTHIGGTPVSGHDISGFNSPVKLGGGYW